MSTQFNILLLLCGGLQGALLSVLLVKRKAYRAGYGFLIAYLLVLILQILMKVADKQWLIQNMRTAYFLSYHFPLLYGPLLWAFVCNQCNPNLRFSVKEGLHFLPFLYSFLYNNIDLIYPLPHFLFWPLYGVQGLVVQWISLAVYHTAALRLWQERQKKLKDYSSGVQAFRSQWLRQFILYSFAIGIAISSVTVFLYMQYPRYFELRFGFVLLTVFVYWISYSALRQPALFAAFVDEEFKAAVDKTLPQLPALVVHRPAKKYANSNLRQEEATRIVHDLQRLMAEEKLFADPQLTIDALAARLCTNRHSLSQVLNENLHLSFYEYINGQRVEEARRLLLDERRQHEKIASLAYDAGFNSLSTFNDVFKKMTGQTPSQFRKQTEEASRKQRV